MIYLFILIIYVKITKINRPSYNILRVKISGDFLRKLWMKMEDYWFDNLLVWIN